MLLAACFYLKYPVIDHKHASIFVVSFQTHKSIQNAIYAAIKIYIKMLHVSNIHFFILDFPPPLTTYFKSHHIIVNTTNQSKKNMHWCPHHTTAWWLCIFTVFAKTRSLKAYGLGSDRYTFCQKCFNDIQGDTVTLGDDPTQAQTWVFLFILY